MHKPDKEKVDKALEQFVAAVDNDESIPQEILITVATGVKNHLKGKKAWPTKQGRKKKDNRDFVAQIELIKNLEPSFTDEFIAGYLGYTVEHFRSMKAKAKIKEYNEEPNGIPQLPSFANYYQMKKAFLQGKFNNNVFDLMDDLIDNYSKKA